LIGRNFSGILNLATTAPQAEIAKKPKTKEPKVKKVDAKEWCQEIKDHPDVKKNWVVLSAEGFEVLDPRRRRTRVMPKLASFLKGMYWLSYK
jgi:hypothetical protein